MNQFWLDRPVLITGATGLVGSWLVKKLLDSKAELICLVRDWVPQSELMRTGMLEQIRVVRGDICDQSLMERVLGEYEINTVFHLAAQTLVPVANRNPVATFESNIAGTWCVLEACRRSPQVKQIVMASSDKAYGEAEKLPYEESTPLKGIHPYDVSKSCADLISQSYAKTYGLPVVITRCGNFYGGGDLNWNRLVPGTIRSILNGHCPVIRSDGTMMRDYFYVEDGVNAYMHLAQKLSFDRTLIGEAFNFSNDERLTVLELVSKILKFMNSSLEPEIVNNVCYEIKNQFLDSSKARKRLDWMPSFTIEEGLQKTIEWYKNI
jgi:CDP-glucose 4,6-dehydratase